MKKFTIISTYYGTIAPLGPDRQLTAIVKEKKEIPLFVSKERFAQDEVANLVHHGGPNRVVHQYASENYAFWKNFYKSNPDPYVHGSYGENICTLGATEEDLCIGDIIEVGSCLLQITEPRRPCATLNLRYQNPKYLIDLMGTWRWGWFYKVLKEGHIKFGDNGILLERPYPNLTIAKTIQAVYGDKKNEAIAEEMAQCEPLSQSWKKYAERVLKSQ